jgi:hypothetical protein
LWQTSPRPATQQKQQNNLSSPTWQPRAADALGPLPANKAAAGIEFLNLLADAENALADAPGRDDANFIAALAAGSGALGAGGGAANQAALPKNHVDDDSDGEGDNQLVGNQSADGSFKLLLGKQRIKASVTPEEMAAIFTNIAVWFLAAARVKALLEKRGLSTAGLNAYTARVMSYAKDLPVGDAQGRGELFVLDRKARIAQARGKAWEKLSLEHDRALIVFTHKAAARVAQAELAEQAAKSQVRATRAPAAAAAAKRAAPRGVNCNKFFNSTNGTCSYGAGCSFVAAHKCLTCGSIAHGTKHCANTVPGAAAAGAGAGGAR